MIVLLIILVVAAVGGIAAYVVMQYSGLGGSTSGGSGGTPYISDRRGRSSGPLAERIADAPNGCLVAVLAAVGIWVALWLIVLVLGLRVLTA